MDVKAYCAIVKEDLTQWKARIYDLMSDADRRSADNATISSAISRLNKLVNDLETKTASLEASCPADWSVEKEELDDIRASMRDIWQEAVEMSPDDAV
jgi:hypothetical protein